MIFALGGVAEASAAPTRNAAAAEALFEAGRAAANSGDHAAARAKFAESYRMDPAAGTLLNWATSEERLGLIASAWQHFREALRLLPPGDDRVAFAEERVRALEPLLPRLTLRVRSDDPQGTVVRVNGDPWQAASWDTALPVDPGEVLVIVERADHYDQQFRTRIAAGQSLTLDVYPGPALPESSTSRDSSAPAAQRTVGFVLAGVGAIGFGMGIASGIMVDLRKRTVDQHCADSRCDDAGLRAARSGDTWLTVNTVSWSVGTVALLTGAALVFTSPRAAENVSIALAPGGTRLAYARSF